MTRKLLKGMTMLSVLLLLAFVTTATSANAQSLTRQVADIPFDFQVGDNGLPAGRYEVMSSSAAREAIRVRSTENGKVVIRLSSAAFKSTPVKKGVLVFHRYGNRYYLAEIWTAGASNGRRFLKSSAERTDRDLAAAPSKGNMDQQGYEKVEVAFVRQ